MQVEITAYVSIVFLIYYYYYYKCQDYGDTITKKVAEHLTQIKT